MLVGAPKANTSQPGVLQGGAVYLCPWGAGSVHCSPIEFDSKGNPLGSGKLRKDPGVGLRLGGGSSGAGSKGAEPVRVCGHVPSRALALQLPGSAGSPWHSYHVPSLAQP